MDEENNTEELGKKLVNLEDLKAAINTESSSGESESSNEIISSLEIHPDLNGSILDETEITNLFNFLNYTDKYLVFAKIGRIGTGAVVQNYTTYAMFTMDEIYTHDFISDPYVSGVGTGKNTYKFSSGENSMSITIPFTGFGFTPDTSEPSVLVGYGSGSVGPFWFYKIKLA